MSWSGLNKTAPKLGAIDLNLLVVFDAIMRDRSVTRAGNRLGLSQPAMSHALTRLRHMLKDELFVRSPTGMMPTPRAEELATPIRIALEGLQQSLEPVQFEPSEATRTFHIAVDNYAAIVLVAPIAARIAKIAPGVTLDFRPSGTLDVLQLLDRSELDSALGRFGAQGGSSLPSGSMMPTRTTPTASLNFSGAIGAAPTINHFRDEKSVCLFFG